MEITKYLCEFFFDDIWHYLGLVVLVGTIFHKEVIKIVRNYKKEEK